VIPLFIVISPRRIREGHEIQGIPKTRESEILGKKKKSLQAKSATAARKVSLRRRQSARHGEGRDHRERKPVRARDDLKPW